MSDPRPKPVKPGDGTSTPVAKDQAPAASVVVRFFQEKNQPKEVSFEIAFTPARAGDRLEVHPYLSSSKQPIVIATTASIWISPKGIATTAGSSSPELDNGYKGWLDKDELLDPDSARVGPSVNGPQFIDVTFKMQNVLTGFSLRRAGLFSRPYWDSGHQPSEVLSLRVVEVGPKPQGDEKDQRIEYYYEGKTTGGKHAGFLVMDLVVPPPASNYDVYWAGLLDAKGQVMKAANGAPILERLAAGPHSLVFGVSGAGVLYYRSFDTFDPVVNDLDMPKGTDGWHRVGLAHEMNMGLRDMTNRMTKVGANPSTDLSHVQLRFRAFGCSTGIELQALELRTEPCWTDPNCTYPPAPALP